jgi:hypothetical protein
MPSKDDAYLNGEAKIMEEEEKHFYISYLD